MTKKQLIDSFEQVDEFCIQYQEIDETMRGISLLRYEWICTKDLDQFHACESGWEIVKVHFDKDGYFEGTVLNRCQKCGEEFESKYSEACDNPEVLDIETLYQHDLADGQWKNNGHIGTYNKKVENEQTKCRK